MVLKYQKEIDNFELDIACPGDILRPSGIEAYRWSFATLGHPLNFLPNVIFDRATNSPFDYDRAAKQIKCRRCGASYFTGIQNAKDKWETISIQIRRNLGYTHLAAGQLDDKDGVMKQPDKEGHFGFYEYADADLVNKFTLIDILDAGS